jgi:class 3 adenylate cyclase
MVTAQYQAVLFADVSGSTRLYERLGDRLALALIERCVSTMQNVTRHHRGTVVKTIGDEVMAVFNDASVACRAAMDMQIEVCTLPESIEHGLTIHCGFHHGEVMLANDGDVFGDTVNVAKRLAEASKSSQIVTSGEVVKLLPADLAAQTRFLDSEQVKGRVAPLELHEVLWEPDVELTEMAGDSRLRPQLRTEMVLLYRGREYRLDDEHPAISLGRDARADIVLLDKLASRNHCRVEKARDKFTFLDFSSNGSYVQTAGQEEVLVRRDEIVLQDRGTISFGRPEQSDPEAAVSFEVLIRS